MSVGGGVDQAPMIMSFRVTEDSVWALIMVKARPSGCPDARGILPAFLVPYCQTQRWGHVSETSNMNLNGIE